MSAVRGESSRGTPGGGPRRGAGYRQDDLRLVRGEGRLDSVTATVWGGLAVPPRRVLRVGTEQRVPAGQLAGSVRAGGSAGVSPRVRFPGASSGQDAAGGQVM
jgi:hypothetical protein